MKALGTAIADIYTNTKFNGIAVFGTQSAAGGVLADQTVPATPLAADIAATIKYGENANQSIDILQATTTKLNALTTLTAAATTGTNAALVTVTSVEDAITEVNTTRAACLYH